MILYTISPQVCNSTTNATHMECWAPAFPEEMPEEKSVAGEIFIRMDGKSQVWKSRFDYHANVKVIPFENEDKILLLKPGETEVSLHVRLDTLHQLVLFSFFPIACLLTSKPLCVHTCNSIVS